MDAAQFTRATGEVTRELEKVNKGLLAVKVAAGVELVKQIGRVGSQLGTLATELFQTGVQSEAFARKYEATFGSATATLDEWVTAHHEAFGVAEDEVQGYLAQIGNLLIGMGNTADEAGQQATQIMETAAAWSAWSGGIISVQAAADKLVRGMVGQTRGLIELGMKISEQEVAARMAAEGLDQLTGEEASRAQQQVMWTLIQEKSTTAMEAYGEAMDGAYGDQQRLRTALDEAKDSMGAMVAGMSPLLSGLAQLGSVPVLGTSLLGILVGGKIAGVPGALAGGLLALLTGLSEAYDAGGDLDQMRSAVDLFNDVVAEGAVEDLPRYIEQLKLMGDAGNAAATQLQLTGRSTLQMRDAMAAVMSDPKVQALINFISGGMFADNTPTLPSHAFDSSGIAQQIGQGFYEGTAEGLAWAAGRLQRDAGIHQRIVDALGYQVMAPFRQAFRETVATVRQGFDDIGNAFVAFELPDITIEDMAENLADWQEAQDDVEEMLAALGDHGLDAFAMALMQGLTPQQLAAIAAVWGGDLRSLYALLPAYGPGGSLHPGHGNPPVEERAGGGPVRAGAPYVVGENGPELFVPGASGKIVPNGRAGSTVVNVGMVIGDDAAVAKAVDTALRRAKLRGG